jgi:hypothetical protein
MFKRIPLNGTGATKELRNKPQVPSVNSVTSSSPSSPPNMVATISHKQPYITNDRFNELKSAVLSVGKKYEQDRLHTRDIERLYDAFANLLK